MNRIKRFTATQLRMILSLSLVAIILIAGIVFYFAESQLRQVATDVSHTVVDAEASQNNVTTLEKIKDILEKEKDVVARAQSIVADSQKYQYQDQIITDLNQFAERTNVSITNVDFTATAATTPTPTAAPSGLKTTSVVITLKTPVDYNNLLRFIESIEQNLTKMQISKVSLSRDASGGNNVTSDALTIEVYIR
jgi:uncharacterized protein (UPF0333 family)